MKLDWVTWYLSYFSMAVNRHHDQGSLEKKSLTGESLTVSEHEPMTIVVRSVASGRQVWWCQGF